ncbi:ATP-binding protein [Rhizobium leguminosarum bv. viciae]|uniref:ATP-binding protein n=1 Tax=Rhizobium leguminosarum TaxID=384 RepID=UPI00103BB53E|nr:AAA family ATPase [Rhizobium leguminosarum]MBY5530195.1 ATP-binding protein [Rhizobium leguminosarum]TBY30667.1 ATP-binding protein [Rhizobium leguminosarum bv. viciae]TBY35723.1 ATP-binding protein [Rhizobium leguminosarum bv. viciae]TCA94813.1 ATP-binding protein [Rhizobium leguminosarum bv. viciae]
MNTAAWHADNTAFLSASVAWVRARMATLAAAADGSEKAGKRVEAGTARDPRIGVEKKIDNGHVPALVQLTQVLGLSTFEQDVLLLCTASALDAGVGALCAAANGDGGKPFPTFALAMRLFDEPAWEALAPSGGLRYWRLIEIHQPANEPLINSPLRADERIVNYLKGLNHIDDRIGSWIRPIAPAGSLPPSQAALCDRVQSFLRADDGSGRAVVQLLGPGGAAKREIAAEISRDIGRELWRLSAASLADLGGDLDTFARLLLRESILLDAVLYVDFDEGDGAGGPSMVSLLTRLLDRLYGMVVILAVRDPLQIVDRLSLAELVGKPTTSEQQEAWLGLLGPAQEATASLLAGQFNLDIAGIEQIAARAGLRGGADKEDELWQEAREAVRPRVVGLAEQVDAKAGWDDLVLPARQVGLLHELAAQLRHQWTVYQQWGFGGRANRGLGIGALFCGGSGTGKNMAAEVVARHVKLDLYRIDLASVVSKYIGETEKNLRRVFDAFEDGGAILFFDEADALFGKRSEVKDSHDRYANIEINYLLQRMEAYRGLVILATNRRSALDQAFMRRLRFIIDFPYPGVAERAGIWQRVFPEETPTEKLDFERLARLALSGGNIHSVAMNTAFRAASENRKVSMELILACARDEVIKLDMPVNEADFRLEPEMRRIA